MACLQNIFYVAAGIDVVRALYDNANIGVKYASGRGECQQRTAASTARFPVEFLMLRLRPRNRNRWVQCKVVVMLRADHPARPPGGRLPVDAPSDFENVGFWWRSAPSAAGMLPAATVGGISVRIERARREMHLQFIFLM
jgi:hypothetical protein